jgi:hypothetical protein
MRKWMMVAAVMSCMWGAQAQVQSGTLVESGRKQVGTSSFTINGPVSGTVIIELAVNRLGEVTAAKVIPDGTTITSTPSVMKAQNAAKKLKFTPGTHFAEFEHVRVKYTYKKQ